MLKAKLIVLLTLGFVDAALAVKSISYGSSFNQAIYHEQTLSVVEGQNLGQRAAINPAQTHMVISSPIEETMGYNSGAVYLFEKVNGQWQEVNRLLPPWQHQNLFFGQAVAITDQWIIVGMPIFSGLLAGQVLIYDLSGQLNYVLSENNTTGGEFGSELDVHGNTLIVSAKRSNHTGRAWIYQYNEMSQIWQSQELVNPMPQSFAEFGSQVKLNESGDEALVTASFHDLNGFINAGIAHVFAVVNGNWQHQVTLEPDLPAHNGFFGLKADISTEVIAINQGLLTGGDTTDDRVDIFEKNLNGNWVHTQVFQEPGFDDRYGFNVSVDGSKLMVSQSLGVQINYRSGFNQWPHQEFVDPNLIDPSINLFGTGSLIRTNEFLLGSSYTNGVTLLEQQPINQQRGGLCNDPNLCEWSLLDRVDRADISDTRIGDQFGVSVAVSGDVAVIGVYADDDQGENAGAAYVYQYQPFHNDHQWFSVAKLYASDGESGDQFGRHVAIDGNRIVIGAHLDDVFSDTVNADVTDAGSIYLFENINGQWLETQKIISGEDVNGAGDRFGFSFDFNQSRLLVGAYQDDENGQNSGAVHAYEWNGSEYLFTEKIMPIDGQTGDGFGYAVSLDGIEAVIGAYLVDAPGLNVGAAYVYKWLIPPIDGWIEQDKIFASSAVLNAGTVFGAAVSIDDDLLVVGAPKHELFPTTDHDSGSVFVYSRDLQSNTWNQIQALAANDKQSGAQFGRAVALDGGRLVIGAWLRDYMTSDNTTLPNAGAAYFYRWDDMGGDFQTGAWQLGAELVAASPVQQSVFGHAAAISSDTIFIGAHRTGSANLDFGNAEIFVDDLIFQAGF